jgi:hypothetical protein
MSWLLDLIWGAPILLACLAWGALKELRKFNAKKKSMTLRIISVSQGPVSR